MPVRRRHDSASPAVRWTSLSASARRNWPIDRAWKDFESDFSHRRWPTIRNSSSSAVITPVLKPSYGTRPKKWRPFSPIWLCCAAAGDLFLLIQPSALNDLRLDEGQRAKVADLSSRAGKRWMETFGDPDRLPNTTERVRLGLEQARANQAEIETILTSTQQLRLRQIALQSEGAGAFREPEVVDALRLTSRQRETDPGHRGRSPDRPVARDARDRHRRKAPRRADRKALPHGNASSPCSRQSSHSAGGNSSASQSGARLRAFPTSFGPPRAPSRPPG